MFGNRRRQDAQKMLEQECGLDPVLHVMDSLKDYHTELVQKEVASLRELDETIQTSSPLSFPNGFLNVCVVISCSDT